MEYCQNVKDISIKNIPFFVQSCIVWSAWGNVKRSFWSESNLRYDLDTDEVADLR